MRTLLTLPGHVTGLGTAMQGALGPVNPLDALVSRLDIATFVVTAADEHGPSGCKVRFATQCSVEPPRFVVLLPISERTYAVATEAQALAVHLVSFESEITKLFGHRETTGSPSFEKCVWRPGITGAPVLRDCQAWVEGDVLERLRLGDHVGFVIAPVDGGAGRETGAFGEDRARLSAGRTA